MPDVKFYEQGRRSGDFMEVQSRIEGRKEWAIVLDHTGSGSMLDPKTPHYEVWVNGQLMGWLDTLTEAQNQMQRCLDGTGRCPK